jgi:hypothetical protein
VLLRPLVRRAVEVPLLAAAVWVVAFWWLRLLPFAWERPVILLGASSFCVGLLLWKRGPDLGSVAVWSCAVVVLAILCASALVPPGVDGAMHTAMARLIHEAHGHPSSFRPLWPLDFFHSYPVGQPTLTALFGALGDLDPRRAGVVGHAIVYALCLVAFASAVDRWTPRPTGLVAGLVAVLAARAPLHFWTWGGAPNALGIAFAIAALAAGIDALRGDRRSAAVCGLHAAASLLTHGVSVAALAWASPLLVAGALFARPDLRRGTFALVLAGCLAVILCIPYLATFHAVLGPREVEWVRNASRDSASFAVFPRMLHDVPLLAGAVAIPFVLWTRPRRAVFPLALGALVVLLVLNGRIFALPGSAILYPDRVAVLALYPIALLAHDALEGRGKIALAACVALCIHAAVLQTRTLRTGRANALATDADLALLGSVALPQGCVVANNYGDAGQWIPALLAHPISWPQVNVLFFDEVASEVHPCAAFRGEKRPYFVDTLPCPGAACEPWRSLGAAQLYRIVEPGLRLRIDPYR